MNAVASQLFMDRDGECWSGNQNFNSPQSADITIPECRFGQGTSKQSNDRPPNETTRALCQPCCEPANACCAALDDLQLLSPQVWLTAIVRKVYHLQRDGAPQRARAACLIHGACLCIAGYGIMYVTLQQTSMVDQG